MHADPRLTHGLKGIWFQLVKTLNEEWFQFAFRNSCCAPTSRSGSSRHNTEIVCAVCSRCVDCPEVERVEPIVTADLNDTTAAEDDVSSAAAGTGEPQPGSSYTEWGVNACSNQMVQTVFSGVATAALYTEDGGPSDVVCQPNDPAREDTQNNNRNNQDGGYLYLLNYASNIQDYGVKLAREVSNRIIPCAQCFVPDAVVFDNHGSAECPEGYDVEYHGFMFTGFIQHRQNKGICVNNVAEPHQADMEVNVGQRSWVYPIEIEGSTHWGSLPYGSNRGLEVTCSVCSRKVDENAGSGSVVMIAGRTSCPSNTAVG